MLYRILLVDDEPLELVAWTKALKREGYSVFTASTADQALKLCDEHSFDLIVLDLIMPTEGGVELLSRIRKRLPYVRSLIVSGKIDDQVSEQDLSQSLKESVEADFYLHKPISNDRLKEYIQKLLEKGEQDGEWKDFAKTAIKAQTKTLGSAKQTSKGLKKLLKKRKK
jgi:CheY-like chemotaxis protein